MVIWPSPGRISDLRSAPVGLGPRRAAESARRSLFPGTGLADRERPALERLLVESTDGFFGDTAVCVVDEGEAPGASGFAIDRQHDLCRDSHARKVLAQVRLVGGVRQIPDEQTD
jgi:hypothetical protein